MVVPPDYNNPIIATRPGWSKRLVEVYLGKRYDRHSPFALVMLVVLVGLFFAFALLVTTGLWYVGLACLLGAVCIFLLVPVSRR